MTTRYSFDSFCSQELNDSQRRAVLHEQGPILVIAGAGSGKTRVITARITHLLTHHHVPPQSIVALTFTNKAALEMKHRIQQFLPDAHALPFIGTFHSYCVRLLRSNQEKLATPFISILDDDDQQKMIASLIQKHGLQKQISARQALYAISQMKNDGIDHVQAAKTINHPFLIDLYKAYETEKKLSKCLDFDDLLLEAFTLFKHHATFATTHQSIVRHLLVDEYQDTNVVQHNLLKSMALADHQLAIDSLCAVGDEDQSIYSWRGATVTNILNFTKDFPTTTTIKIEQNYRSVQQILDGANHLIEHNTNRNKKTLWSEKRGTDRIRLLTCLTEYHEAEIVAQLLLRAKEAQKLAQHSVLYRTHAQSRALEEALVRHTIPYKIIGGIQFYERKEIKDLIAYLRLILNPYDRTSFMRVLNTPTRGFGQKFEELALEIWNAQPFFSFKQVLHEISVRHTPTGIKQKNIITFLALFEALESTSITSAALTAIIKKTDYISFLKDQDESQEAQARIDNVQELIDAATYAESTGTHTIVDFIEQITLMQEKTTKQNSAADTVTLMSLHAAKGLEFDTVVITGLEESILPSSRSFGDLDALQEERRLLYVGITRARERLLLTHAKHRYTYGRLQDQIVSRFLHEIPSKLLQTDDCSNWKSYQIQPYFSEWLEQKQQSTATVQPLKKIPQQSATLPHAQMVSTFKMNQPVQHATYGVGIVTQIEHSSDQSSFITVRFKTGSKKIMSSFLKPV